MRQAKKNNNGWVNGQYFLRTLMLSQYHARIWDLERQGYVIERGSKDEFGFCSYRLQSEPADPNIKEFCCIEEWRGERHNPKCFKMKDYAKSN